MIRVESVRIMKTNLNYQRFFKALWIFDMLVSDGDFASISNNVEIKSKDISIMNKLFENISSFDEYIQSMFKSYVRNKKQININLLGLSKLDEDHYRCIMRGKVRELIRSDTSFGETSFRWNLISSRILGVLPYSKYIVISTTGPYGKGTSYPFNLQLFAEIVSRSRGWKQITIKQRMRVYEIATRHGHGAKPKRRLPSGREDLSHRSWLDLYWSQLSERIIAYYEAKGLKIVFESNETNDDESVIITRNKNVGRLVARV